MFGQFPVAGLQERREDEDRRLQSVT
jgi:hypothetical protein